MNRRRFAISAAMLALSGRGAFASQSSMEITSYVSELTGAEINWNSDQWKLSNSGITDKGRERLDLYESGVSIHFKIIPATGTPVADNPAFMVMEMLPGSILSPTGFDTSDWVVGSDSDSDGNITHLAYCEYQRDAFPGHHLGVLYWGETGLFQSELARVQRIDFAGLPPFQFLDLSNIEKFEIEDASGDAIAPATGLQMTSEDYLTAVSLHVEDGQQSFMEFRNRLPNLDSADQNVLEKEVSLAAPVAEEWRSYLDRATQLAPPASLADLHAHYLKWAGMMRDMSYVFEYVTLGDATSSTLGVLMEQWQQVHNELQNELNIHKSSSSYREAVALSQIKSALPPLAKLFR